jgi:hypothetical protein
VFRPHGPSSGVLIVVAKTVILLKFIQKSFLRHDSYAPYLACSLFFDPGSSIPVPGAAVCLMLLCCAVVSPLPAVRVKIQYISMSMKIVTSQSWIPLPDKWKSGSHHLILCADI